MAPEVEEGWPDLLTQAYTSEDLLQLSRFLVVMLIVSDPASTPDAPAIARELELGEDDLRFLQETAIRETDFYRSATMPWIDIEDTPGTEVFSFRGYVERLLGEVMRPVPMDFDLESIANPVPEEETRRRENARTRVLIGRARACLTLAWVHDPLWRHAVMSEEAGLAPMLRASVPDTDRAWRFLLASRALSDQLFAAGNTLTLETLAETAADTWLFGAIPTTV